MPSARIIEQDSSTAEHAASIDISRFRLITGMPFPQLLVTQPSRGLVTVHHTKFLVHHVEVIVVYTRLNHIRSGHRVQPQGIHVHCRHLDIGHRIRCKPEVRVRFLAPVEQSRQKCQHTSLSHDIQYLTGQTYGKFRLQAKNRTTFFCTGPTACLSLKRGHIPTDAPP